MAQDYCSIYWDKLCENGTMVSCELIKDNTTGNQYLDYECAYNDPPDLFKESYVTETIPLLGYLLPVLAIPTILANILAISVFVRKSMRSATTILLVFLALSDDMICMSFLPTNFYYFTLQNYKTYVPYDFCVFDYVAYVMHRMFRTTSNWITVVLGLQRLIVVYYPFKAKRLCNIKTSIISAICCFLFAFALHFILIISINISRGQNKEGPDGCYREYSNVLGKTYDARAKSLRIYLVLSGIFSRLLPCIVLVVATTILIYALNKESEIRLAANIGSRINSQTRRVSLMVLIVMVVFIITEMQDVVNFGIYIYELTVYGELRKVLTEDADTRWTAYGVTLSVIGYNLNFWIYILMSDQFRQNVWGTIKTIGSVLTCGRLKKVGFTTTSTLTASNRTAATTYKMSFSIASQKQM